METLEQQAEQSKSDRYVLRIAGAALVAPATKQGTIVFVAVAICLFAVIVVLALTIGHTALVAAGLLR